MQPPDDGALLRQFAENQSDEAFATLVTRHLNLVYSVALRQVGNPHSAEEITQAVFIILAKKASSLRHQRALSSWLFQATRLTANNFIRREARRHRREQEAHVQSMLNESTSDVWPQIAPLLDTAVANLREKDRQAIVMRFYEGRNLRDVGTALGASEAAAEKRVNRALERLRNFFSKRGVSFSTVVIAGAISIHSAQAAPSVLAKTVTALAITKGATASGSTLTLIKGALKLMAWTKAKMAIITGAALILAAGATTIVVEKVQARTKDGFETRAFYIDRDLFIKNLIALAPATMNAPSTNWGEVLLDVLRIQGVDCTTPKAIALIDNKSGTHESTGKVIARNTPEAMKKIEQTVMELNDTNGVRDFLLNIPIGQQLSFRGYFYNLSSKDFKKIDLGKSTASAGTVLSPAAFKQIKKQLQTQHLAPFNSPGITTGYGIDAKLYMGDSGTNIEFECLPISFIPQTFFKDAMIDVKVEVRTTGYFNDNPNGDWPDSNGRTNCAFYAEENIPDKGGLLFQVENPSGNHLLILVEAGIKTKK